MAAEMELTEQVVDYKRRTGEDSLLVVFFDDEREICGIHRVGHDPLVGLLIDGKLPAQEWLDQIQDFEALQHPPKVLH